MGIKFLGTVEIKENMTTEELDRKISIGRCNRNDK